MELIRVCTSTAPGLRIWLNALRKDLIRLGHHVEIIDNGAVHGALLQPDREQGGLELLTRLQWHGEPGTDETLQQFRDQVSALVSSIPGLSLRSNSTKPALDLI
jgi:hypothetical protein